MPLPLASSSAQARVADRIAPQIFEAPRALGLWHLASVDAPTVAVVWSLAFAWAARVRLPILAPLLLGLGTWCVYVADRLLDALAGLREPMKNSLRERHYFHWRHRRALLPLAIGAGAAAGILLCLTPPVTRAADAMLGAAALIYFFAIHAGRNARQMRRGRPRLWPGKEFLVGVLFAAGCVMPAWLGDRTTATMRWAFGVSAGNFAALAWLNCRCIAQWELAEERIPPTRFGTHESKAAIFPACVALACGGLVLAVIGARADWRTGALLGAGSASALLLALLDRRRSRMTALALRAAADLALLTPLPLLMVAWALR